MPDQSPEIPTYTSGELEEIASDFLGKRCPEGLVVPIDIDLLIERTGLEIVPVPGMYRDHRVKGVPVFVEGVAR
ncbi:MAG: hypothetical protein HYT89_06420 [Candidatus Omnitrophica bacterium]|nr:hypothetical protein [Candidatus Omnitrophota bacterium]